VTSEKWVVQYCLLCELFELWSILVLFVSKIVHKFIQCSELEKACVLQLLRAFIVLQYKNDLLNDLHVRRQNPIHLHELPLVAAHFADHQLFFVARAQDFDKPRGLLKFIEHEDMMSLLVLRQEVLVVLSRHFDHKIKQFSVCSILH